MDKKRYGVVATYTAPFVQVVMEKGQQQEVFEKLYEIRAIFEETHLAGFLSHIGVDGAEKEKALRLFQGTNLSLLDHFIEVILQNHRESYFYDMVVDSLGRLEKITNEFDVVIKSVSPLSSEQKARLRPLIEKKFNLKVRAFQEELDHELIGGFVVTANNKTIDASIKRQLQAVKEKLK
ncbi:F0F1 ATP synthase subunit delta [Streptococcus himalayensis]|uniref:ATP synthase subunit delta n=1 Tax=Streptococcus himalayensis TaxID=1888195 RepID=A0A917A3V6_9STRE|nr:F0F1 ATP synthase subunit delta [Streptococcus himalayensis]GGE25555.1 ATP synthase subunit delta [Streptococcus himalayensis]